MSKFRRNHQKGGSGIVIRFIIFGIILIAFLLYLYKELGGIMSSVPVQEDITVHNDIRTFIPSAKGEVIHHKNYSLSYIESHEQPEWVAYELTRENLKMPNVPRSGRFNPDYSISTRSAFHRDYTGSGYTRGHLAPAGDMAHNDEAMKESFFMSNISPQKRKFNNGIWKELEEQVRDWAFSSGKVIVVTGPILTEGIRHKIGDNKVSVPDKFFKIILDIGNKSEKAISFVIPNEVSNKPLSDYAMSIDQVEELTGIDFFADFLNDREEEKLESSIDIRKWKFSDKRYQLRVDKWNYQ